MKLEGELAFCHPNIDLEPESESFEFSDINPVKVKENDKNISFDLESDEGNSIPTQYVMEEVDGLIASKLVCPTGMVDLENNDEAKVWNFVEPVSHSSQDTEASNAKRSHDVWIHDSPEELDSCENSEDTYYSDECVVESQPELIVCCKESNYHFIKDICVDEGVPAMDKVWHENSVDEKDVSKFLPFDTSKTEVLEKDNSKLSVSLLDVLDLAVAKASDKVPAKHHQSEDLIQRDENASENFADQNKEMVLLGSTILSQEIEPEARPPHNKGDEVELNHAEVYSEPESQSKHEESKNRVEEVVLANPSANELDSDILVGDNNFVLVDCVSCWTKEECHQDGSCKCDDFQNAAKPEDGRSITSQVSQCKEESSFSAVSVSSHICYSGPILFSGSISLRSDSSTTSMRSFAFPILQHEWNSSPVRMAKADKRHHRRQRSWREGLLCCRF